MKIIHITAAYKPAYIYGGPTMSVAKLCEALVEDEDEVEVEVFTTTANGKTELAVVPGERQVVDGVRVTYFKRLTKDHTHFSPGLLRGLRREILHAKENPPPCLSGRQATLPINRDIPLPQESLWDKGGHTLAIHIHAWWNLVSILSCWLAKWYHVPVVLSPRGMLTDYTLGNRNVGFKSIIHSLIGKRLLRYCHIHATSEKEKEDILKFIKPKSITVIANLVEGVASSEYRVASSEYQDASIEYQEAKDQSLAQQLNNCPPDSYRDQPSSSFKLIFLSRIEKKKGLELLFDALADFDVDWSLTIAGSGEAAYIEGLVVRVEGLGISNRINWVGQVKNEDKFKLLAENDLMVLTSYNENFANVVIESLSVGTPILLSNEVGLADYVIAKDLGWISELNAESIAEQLNHSYRAISKREEIRTEAPKLIATDYNDITLIKKYIKLYEQVING